MKKWFMAAAGTVLLLALAACGQTAEVDEPDDSEVVVKSDLSAKDVLEKTSAASEAQQSMHADMEIVQTLQMGEETQDIHSKIDMDLIMEPLTVRQTMAMEVEGEETALDLFITKEGFFMKDPASGQWMKFPGDMYEEMVGAVNQPVDFTMYEQFAEEFTVEETADAYVLSMKGSGEKFSALMQDIMEQNMPAAMDEEQLEVLSNMNVEQIDMKFTVDKKTFYTKDFDIDMVMTVEEQGEQVRMTQNMKGVVSKINEIDEIVVPKEVIENAADMNSLLQQ